MPPPWLSPRGLPQRALRRQAARQKRRAGALWRPGQQAQTWAGKWLGRRQAWTRQALATCACRTHNRRGENESIPRWSSHVVDLPSGPYRGSRPSRGRPPIGGLASIAIVSGCLARSASRRRIRAPRSSAWVVSFESLHGAGDGAAELGAAAFLGEGAMLGGRGEGRGGCCGGSPADGARAAGEWRSRGGRAEGFFFRDAAPTERQAGGPAVGATALFEPERLQT